MREELDDLQVCSCCRAINNLKTAKAVHFIPAVLDSCISTYSCQLWISVGQGCYGCVSHDNVIWQSIRFFWAQDGLFFWTFKQKYFEWTGILFYVDRLGIWCILQVTTIYANDCWLLTAVCFCRVLCCNHDVPYASKRLWVLKSFVVNLDHEKCGGRTPCANSLLPGVTWIWSCAALFWAALPFACASRTCCPCHIWWKGRGLDVQDYQTSSPNSNF